MESFYATVATFSFTLLGLWWGVVQLRHKEWMSDPEKRRMANSIYLALLVPAVMSLGAQIAPDIRLMWQTVFILASIGGIVATISVARAMRQDATQSTLSRVTRWTMAALYTLILLTALAPQVFGALGLTGLQGEAIWVTLLIFMGVTLAWEGLTSPETGHTQV